MVKADKNILRMPWEDVSRALSAKIEGRNFSDIQLLGDVWGCGVGTILLDAAAEGGTARRAAWEKALQEMCMGFMSDEQIAQGLEIFADALGWPEEDRRLSSGEDTVDMEEVLPQETVLPEQGATMPMDGIETMGIGLVEPEESFLPEAEEISAEDPVVPAGMHMAELLEKELVSLEAFRHLQQARSEVGLERLQIPLHILVRGGAIYDRELFVEGLAKKGFDLGLLTDGTVWDSLGVPDDNAVWHIRASDIPHEQLNNIVEVLRSNEFLAVLTGTTEEIDKLLDICPYLRYSFGRTVNLDEESEAAGYGQ